MNRGDELELSEAMRSDLDALMRWVDSAGAVRAWGGPGFRFPFDAASFLRDCRWPEMASYVARKPDETQPVAFGQFYEYRERIHFARLIVQPGLRGRGIGRRFIRLLAETAAHRLPLDEVSLFVYRDNAPALRCYRALGFAKTAYPPDRPLAEDCFFLTRRLDSPCTWE